jgi:hypothetical protein
MVEEIYQQWVVVGRYRSGDIRYLGERRGHGGPGLVPFSGNAYRYATELKAQAAGYEYQSYFLDGKFTLDRLSDTSNPRDINF